jgi:predicted MPP superfamily phosphohydrolase
MTKKITWVHLSDLHVGQKKQWLWPNFRSNFLDDLKRQSEKVGPIDLVIFSGDLTQTGESHEYKMLQDELERLWEMWSKIGQNPRLFTVPGNHDLQRPDKKDARAKLLTKWPADTEVMAELWDERDNQYASLINDAFANYDQWQANLASSGISCVPVKHGIFPGDVSASLLINDIAVGLVGLNSAALQLNGGEFTERLSLDLRQLNALTDQDPPAWTQRHDINFLVTHHPVSWLALESQKEFRTEIYPAGRFTAHLYGHMHEAELATEFRNGDAGRKSFQSASLFGLEHYGDGTSLRTHGYSIGQIEFMDARTTWKLWPRKARVPKGGGSRKLIPDHENFELEPGEEYQLEELTIGSQPAKSVTAVPAVVDLAVAVEEPVEKWNDALEACSYFLQEAVQHLAIRPLQRQACIEGFRQKKMAWICADWGMGMDGFLWSLLKKYGADKHRVFKVDLGLYERRDSFLDSFSTTAGCAFTEFCKALAAAGPSLLLLDEAPVVTQVANGSSGEPDAEKLATMVRDFCPETLIVLLSRTRPQNSSLSAVDLDPLDEADTRSYLIANPNVGADLKSPAAVSDIFRRTDGVPGRIDSIIRTLRVASLSDLGPSAPLVLTRSISESEIVPLALVRAVTELVGASDPYLQRIYFLLKVLAILSHGESVARLKRIDPRMPVHNEHAESLLDRDLIQVRTSASLIGLSGGDHDRIKIIFAPRPVRDYVLSLMSEKEIDQIVGMATTLYFGEKWKAGQASIKKLGGSLTSDDGSLLENPHVLVMRLLAKNEDWSDSMKSPAILNLCQIYSSALHNGRHYRNCVSVCRDALSVIPEGKYDTQRSALQYLLASSLRMSNNPEEAKQVFQSLLVQKAPKENKIQYLVGLALCLQARQDNTAAAIARQGLDLGAKGGLAIQLESIILEVEDDVSKKVKLLELEKRARQKKYDHVANNLALRRTARTAADEETLDVLRRVHSTAMAAQDPYNASRAAVRIASTHLEDSGQLSRPDLNNLVIAYQYFYGERSDSLFLHAHTALWDFFERNSDVRNLLSLFRHSSFIWRVHGNEEHEKNYVKKLVKSARQILATDLLSADTNTAYFLTRAQTEKIDVAKQNRGGEV